MDLKAIYDNQEEIPELYRDLFAERDGKHVLNVQGVKTEHDVLKLNEGLTKEREAHKKTKERYRAFADLDPSEVQEKLARYAELEEIANSKMDPSRISELADERVAKTKSKYETQLAELQGTLAEYQAKEKRRHIHDAVRKALTENKVVPSAHEDALLLAERIFEVADDGSVLTKDGVGVEPGVQPSAWLTEIQPRRPHWWMQTSGTGASGGGSGAVGSMVNPWKRETRNLTEQMRITKENPTLAEQLKKIAERG